MDSDLKVYGTGNVRVVDASVFTIQLSAHLMAPIYGLAEQAAALIRQEWNVVAVQQSSSNSTNSTGSASGGAPSSTPSSGNDTSTKSAAGHVGVSSVSVVVMALLAVVSSALL